MARNDILNAVWGNSVPVTPRSIDRCVATLRSKIEPDSHHPTYIQTIRDIGYRFEAGPERQDVGRAILPAAGLPAGRTRWKAGPQAV